MIKFKVGDRVRIIKPLESEKYTYNFNNACLKVGDIGTIIRVKDETTIGVKWDKKVDGGHGCDKTCSHGYGWYVPQEFIDKGGKNLSEEFVNIIIQYLKGGKHDNTKSKG